MTTYYYLDQPIEAVDIVEAAEMVAEVLEEEKLEVLVRMKSKGGEE